jgi:AraC-like DNA-binding protein
MQKNQNSYYRFPILDGLELLHAKSHTLDFPFHSHNTFNITLILDQVFTTKVANRFLQAPKGTIVITNPDEVHATLCDNKIGNSFFTFYIAPDILKELNDHHDVFFMNNVIYDDNLFQQLYFMSVCINNLDTLFENKLLLVLHQLILNYADNQLVSEQHSRMFQEFLNDNALEKFSLEKTAKQFGLDKYKFLRLFKQETGLTPNNYSIIKRIEQSKKLLQTDTDLLEVAIETGFYDLTHFSKHFKKITGITPNTYKKA